MKDLPYRWKVVCRDGRNTCGFAATSEEAMDRIVDATDGYVASKAELKGYEIYQGDKLVTSHEEPVEGHKTFITLTQGMSGWFAVMYWWNPEGFWEPYDTGIGRYATPDLAETEAQNWAKEEGLEYVRRKDHDDVMARSNK